MKCEVEKLGDDGMVVDRKYDDCFRLYTVRTHSNVILVMSAKPLSAERLSVEWFLHTLVERNRH